MMSDHKSTQEPPAPPLPGDPKAPRSGAQASKEGGSGGDMQRKKKRPLTDEERKEREVNRRAQHQLISHWRMERNSSREQGDDSGAANAPKAPRLAPMPVRPHQAPPPPQGLSSMPLPHTMYSASLSMEVMRGATILPPLAVPSIMEPKIAIHQHVHSPMLPPLMSPASLFTSKAAPPLQPPAFPSEPLSSHSSIQNGHHSLIRNSVQAPERPLKASSPSRSHLTSLDSLASAAMGTPHGECVRQAARQTPSPDEDRKKPA